MSTSAHNLSGPKVSSQEGDCFEQMPTHRFKLLLQKQTNKSVQKQSKKLFKILPWIIDNFSRHTFKWILQKETNKYKSDNLSTHG